jgi:uncharacterized membrane protein YeaQ/YmgE (transglycosylase-associated protein family)
LWVSSKVLKWRSGGMKSPMGLLANIVLGIVGAAVASCLVSRMCFCHNTS